MAATEADIERFERRGAEPGVCEYCGQHRLVKPDPFGGKPACAEDFFLLIDGSGD